jgi:hypothetical protein
VEEQIHRAASRLQFDRERIVQELTTSRRKAAYLKNINTVFRTFTALLGVLAPALVTYQTQVPTDTWKLAAILTTVLVGTSATLQSTFRWGEAYRNHRLTALRLEVLLLNLDFASQDALDTTDLTKAYDDLKVIHKDAVTEMTRILGEHVHLDVDLMTGGTWFK